MLRTKNGARSGLRAPATPAGRLTVLVVDDNPGDVRLLGCMLEDVPDWQVEVRAALDDDTMALPPAPDVDLVFLDQRLGDRSGLELLRAMRARGDDRPVVMVTGFGDEELAAEALRSGASDYISKSALSPRSLDRIITHLMEKRRLLDEVRAQQGRLERVNRELVRRNEEIRRFHHALSHELKTPMTSAREFVAIVADGIAGPVGERQREYLDLATAACDQMAVMIGDLVDSARLETGKLTLELRDVDLGALVAQAVCGMGGRAAEKDIRLAHRCPPDLPPVTADPHRIRQVLDNLLSNAVKFTPPGGEVTVTATADGDAVSIAVQDSGPGIPQEELGLIFERLYQARAGAAGGGLGLGLSICKDLVALHHGRLGVTSTPGRGSRFTFSLPRTPPA